MSTPKNKQTPQSSSSQPTDINNNDVHLNTSPSRSAPQQQQQSPYAFKKQYVFRIYY
ncbi:hypothetical protein DICPUDRAFT_147929 [Dictyostelium purpureum]|uniref:Uncharacterized protein n=1 Tax=Dictyostelium purpureum TaxID=5786 RepID=F0Z9S8_DICPU|nr:uncharacterized protein DICPUDRAFT_147929 [Dictyostelium purpureum]EGC39263.1 hypothetical protein DICPUDRAFT_147929 [Dictyostelium purpureum]|eukprot:XP_003284167.1 hypothetical protein DICPUDRAFT_147929 [Dictyostelium purpureum]